MLTVVEQILTTGTARVLRLVLTLTNWMHFWVIKVRNLQSLQVVYTRKVVEASPVSRLKGVASLTLTLFTRKKEHLKYKSLKFLTAWMLELYQQCNQPLFLQISSSKRITSLAACRGKVRRLAWTEPSGHLRKRLSREKDLKIVKSLLSLRVATPLPAR